MGRFFNILILLAILSWFKSTAEDKSTQLPYKPAQEKTKGPVYNPLRVKPYVKSTLTV